MMSRREFMIASALAVAGCGRVGGTVAPEAVWGQQGLRDGAFVKPRAIGAHEGRVYVIDTTGRVQIFSEDGDFIDLWKTPAMENGTPTAVAFGIDGRVLIPDTHYSQILEYSPEGELLARWGQYGTGDDEFIYPTGIEQAADGTIAISEYGTGAERVRLFDADRKLIRGWGGPGVGPGEFSRAMDVAWDNTAEQATLFVADTGNGRVQRFDRDGNAQVVYGDDAQIDDARPEMKFPFAIAVAPDGSVVAADYGANGLIRISADGAFLGALCKPGRAPGAFDGPRGVAISESGRVFVADTGNNRIQRFDLGAIG